MSSNGKQAIKLTRLAWLILLLGCEQEVQCREADIERTLAALTNGSEEALYLKLESWEETSVVRISAIGQGQDVTCTGTLVAPQQVLTAAHCVEGLDRSMVEISFFEHRTGESWTTSVATWSAHPSLDLALITLAEDPRDFMAVGTVPPAAAEGDTLRAGMLLQLAGFGEDEDGAIGHRRFSVERVISIESDYITVSAGALGGACAGDSGGPALIRGKDGEVWIAGILDNGSASCFGEDSYTRVALAEDWLIQQLGWVERHEPAGASHVALPKQGRCYDGIAVWSEQGQLRSQACDAGQVCGWDTRSLGFRCIPAGDGSCGTVTDLGECRGDSVWQCVDGILQESPCHACGWRCERSPRTGAAVCLEF